MFTHMAESQTHAVGTLQRACLVTGWRPSPLPLLSPLF
jgi:hypothetical protein